MVAVYPRGPSCPRLPYFPQSFFTAAPEDILRRVDANVGININGEKLNNLKFPDDIILLGHWQIEGGLR